MKHLAVLLTLLLASCGYSSENNEAVGQVKKVLNQTPMLCSNFKVADIVIGSQQALQIQQSGATAPHTLLVITDEQDRLLRLAAEQGKTVKFTYKIKRTVFCYSVGGVSVDHFMETLEFVD